MGDAVPSMSFPAPHILGRNTQHEAEQTVWRGLTAEHVEGRYGAQDKGRDELVQGKKEAGAGPEEVSQVPLGGPSGGCW